MGPNTGGSNAATGWTLQPLNPTGSSSNGSGLNHERMEQPPSAPPIGSAPTGGGGGKARPNRDPEVRNHSARKFLIKC